MIYAQVAGGQKLHLVYEPGEGYGFIVPAGRVSLPLCGRAVPETGFRMTINVPLAHACANCRRVYAARYGGHR